MQDDSKNPTYSGIKMLNLIGIGLMRFSWGYIFTLWFVETMEVRLPIILDLRMPLAVSMQIEV